jgi:hypothetical protein
MISHDGDGFTGVARLTVGATLFNVLVELRGYFEPIDGRYHWYGRVSRNDSLTDVLTGSRASAVLETCGVATGSKAAAPRPSRSPSAPSSPLDGPLITAAPPGPGLTTLACVLAASGHPARPSLYRHPTHRGVNAVPDDLWAR